MKGNRNVDKLSDYGKTFQYKLLHILFSDKLFFEQIYDILDPQQFSTNALKWIISKLKDHYNQYSEIPEIKDFKVYIQQEVDNKTTKVSIIQTLKKITQKKYTNSTEFVKENATDFFKNKNLSKVIMESVELLKNGQYDLIKEKIDDALHAGSDNDLGLDYIDDVDLRYEKHERDTITTGWKVLDNYLNGGLGRKELGAIVAASGVGKSFWLCHLAFRMIASGLKVVYFNLENEDSYIGMRIDSILTGISSHNLSYKIDKVKKKIKEKIKGNLKIKDLPSQISTINTMISFVNRLKIINFNPDAIIVDYGDIIGSVKSYSQDWLDQKQKFEELKSLAQQLSVPVWTASQANKSALEKDIVGKKEFQRAFAKTAPCNFILGLSRKVNDKLNNTGRLHIAKNTFGPDAITLPCYINNEKGKFKLYKPDSKKGKELLDQMGGDEIAEEGRQRLREKFKKFKNIND